MLKVIQVVWSLCVTSLSINVALLSSARNIISKKDVQDYVGSLCHPWQPTKTQQHAYDLLKNVHSCTLIAFYPKLTVTIDNTDTALHTVWQICARCQEILWESPHDLKLAVFLFVFFFAIFISIRFYSNCVFYTPWANVFLIYKYIRNYFQED
jgi:hypothetical protein